MSKKEQGVIDNMKKEALATMKKAARFMMDTVSYRGGFVWSYLPDFSRTWGEMEAKRTMVWVQPPSTPDVGHLMLDAYHATGDEYYYEAAEKIAYALIWGQHPSGGWNYIIDFAGEASLKDWYNTVGKNGWRLEEFQHYYGNATFDDCGTAMCANLLLRMYVEKYDPKFRPALDKAIDFILGSQYPIGGWPQRFPLRNEFSHHGKPDYTSFITLNDDVADQNIEFLLRCHQSLGEKRILDPIYRAMNCILVLQQGDPQAGWAEQYTLPDLTPTGARTYEPTSLMPQASAKCVQKLMEFYRLTGDNKFLARIPDALRWIESTKIPQSDLDKVGMKNSDSIIYCPTFVEIGTNKPLYVHREGSNVVNGLYYADQSFENLLKHYGQYRRIRIKALHDNYEALLKMTVEEATKGSPLLEKGLVPLPKYFMIADGMPMAEKDVDDVIKELNSRGFWPVPLKITANAYIGDGPATGGETTAYATTDVGDKYDTSPYEDKNPKTGITTKSFVDNMAVLINFLEYYRK